MDKVKSLLHKSSGGSRKEDQSTYEEDSYSQTATHAGKLTGEGSHLGSATGPTDTPSSGVGSTTTGPHSSDTMNRADPRVDSNVGQGNITSSDFASKAANTAWSSHNQNAPGAFPQEDTSNPYAASSIDPRVDNAPRTQDTRVGDATTTSTAGPTLGQSTGTSSGFDEYGSSGRTGPSSGFPEHSVASQTPGTSSGLARGSEYGSTAGSGGYDNTTSQSSVPPTSATSDTTGTSNKQIMMGRALGAVGLGGAAARADDQNPSTTTGSGSYGSPSQSEGIPSHHRKESIPTTAYPSGTLDSPRAVAPPVGAPASGSSTAIADESSVGDNSGRAAIGQTSTYGSHYLGSGEPTSSIVDPNSSDPTTYSKPETSHLGRDVGFGAGVGAAGLGATSAYDGSRDQPGVQPGLQSGETTSATGGEHTKFYDAATVGHQPTSSGLGNTGTSQEYGTTSHHHTGRDAATVGAGAGALGAGAYEYEKHRGAQDSATGASTGIGSTTGNTTGTQGYQTTPGTTGASTGIGSTTGNTTGTQGYQTTPGTTSMSQGYGTTSGNQTTSQTGDHHLGRDAAVGGAGVGAVGVGAHEYSKHEEKEGEKEQKAHDKAFAKEERQHEKKLEKSERQHEKAMEKEEKHREKELAKEEKAQEPHSHRKEEAAGVGAVGAGAVGAHEYDQHHDNLGAEDEKARKPSLIQRILHPRSSKASGQDETSGLAAADAADNRAFHEHGDASTRRVSNITPAGYAEAPTKGYATQVTGGTGTTALAQGEGAPSGSHATALGNVFESKDPSARSASAATYPTEGGQATAGTGYAEAPSSGYASQVTGGTGTTALAEGSSGEPVGQGNLTGHQHGIQGSGLTRESMTGQPGNGHQFGEITDHSR